MHLNHNMYGKTQSVDALKLIREVKKHPIIYDMDAAGYTDIAAKENAWEKISAKIYPNYNQLAVHTRNDIKQSVRRKWKSVRNGVNADLRSKKRNKNYQPPTNPILTEMQFIVPFMKSSAVKASQRHNTTKRRRYNPPRKAATHDNKKTVSANDEDVVDLTIPEQKPTIQINSIECFPALNNTGTAVYSVPLTSSINNHQFENMYCSSPTGVVEDETPNIYAAAECNEHYEAVSQQQQQNEPAQNNGDNRQHYSQDNDTDFKEKLISFLSETVFRMEKISKEPKDEDRMFLLSLVSDLKSVSSAKKMLVKAEIVTAIASAWQS